MDKVMLSSLVEKLKEDWNKELEEVLVLDDFHRGRYLGQMDIIEALERLVDSSDVE